MRPTSSVLAKVRSPWMAATLTWSVREPNLQVEQHMTRRFGAQEFTVPLEARAFRLDKPVLKRGGGVELLAKRHYQRLQRHWCVHAHEWHPRHRSSALGCIKQ